MRDARTDPIAWVDMLVGESIDRAIKAHHRRRLRRIGWEHALDAAPGGWAEGDPPPREENSIEILVDGADALPRIAAELERAESHVHLAGWFFSPEFALVRDGQPLVLRNLLARLSERVDVRVLVWAGAPLPLFTPSRRDVRAMRSRLVDGRRIQCALDSRERPLHCHHEKLVVVDDRLAFVGGIDLTSLGGERFDSSDHAAQAQLGWHDAAALLRGPAVADIAEHFRLRWREVTGEELASATELGPAGDVELQIVRTVPEKIYERLPRGDFRILESYVRAIRGAQRLIYLENQFLWSPEIVDILDEKLREPPSDEFRLVAVLPSKPQSGADESRGQVGQLVEADAGAGRFLACSLYAREGSAADPVYVHAKIGIVDDEWLTLGSANLNEHSLFNDTEVNLVARNPSLARSTRLRLWSEHLERPQGEVDGPPHLVVDEIWKPTAEEQLARRQRGEPLSHRLVRLPHVSSRSRRLLGPIQGLLVDG